MKSKQIKRAVIISVLISLVSIPAIGFILHNPSKVLAQATPTLTIDEYGGLSLTLMTKKGASTYAYDFESDWSPCDWNTQFRFLHHANHIEVYVNRCNGGDFTRDGVARLQIYNPGTNEWQDYGFSAEASYNANDPDVNFFFDPINERGGTNTPQRYRVVVGEDSNLPTGERRAWVNFYLPSSVSPFPNYTYNVSSNNYECLPNNGIVELRAIPQNDTLNLSIRPCSGSPFQRNGEAVVYVNDVPYGLAQSYNAGDSEVVISIDPAIQGFPNTQIHNLFVKAGEDGNLPTGSVEFHLVETISGATTTLFGHIKKLNLNPYSNVTVYVHQEDGGYYETQTDSNGYYELTIPEGRYGIGTLSPDYSYPNGFSPTSDELGWIDLYSDRRIDFRANYNPSSGNSNLINVRYVDQVYAQSASGVNRSGWDLCGPSSIAMFLHHYGKENRDILYEWEAITDLSCEVQVNGCQGNSHWYPMHTAIENRNVDVMPPQLGITYAQIVESIDNGHPVILGLGGSYRIFRDNNTGQIRYRDIGHIVLVVGYEGDDTLILNDPYGEGQWWEVLAPERTNQPPLNPPSPKMNGHQVHVPFSSFNSGHAIFTEGAIQPNVAQSHPIDSRGGEVIGADTRISFPAQLNKRSNSTIATVTHQPKLSPSHALVSESVVNIFSIIGQNDDGTMLSTWSNDYELKIQVDKTLLDEWSPSTGIAGIDIESQTQGAFFLYAWDENEQLWEKIPYSWSEDSYIIAHHNHFTEFAVVIEEISTAYLPIVTKQ